MPLANFLTPSQNAIQINVTRTSILRSILRAEIDFMGCVAPVGDHTIRFIFDPVSVRNGRQISAIALLLLGLYAAFRVVAQLILRAARNESGERSGASPPVPRFCTGKLTHVARQFAQS